MSLGSDPLCPWCLANNAVHKDVPRERRQPQNGYVSMCAYCGKLSVFRVTMFGVLLIRATPEEDAEFQSMPEYQELLKARARFLRSPSGFLRE